MKLFELKAGNYSESAKGAPWVSTYGPVNEMPFLDDIPLIKERKQKAWALRSYEPGLYIDPGGTQWTDMIGCGNAPPSFFVSEIIIDDLEANGIPVFRKTEMPIAENRSKRLQGKKPRRYFVVEAEPGIDVDFDASGIVVDSDGKRTFDKKRESTPIIYLDHSTWSGADLFAYRNYGSKMTLLCTEKVKELAERQGWTNVTFQRRAIAGIDPFAKVK